MEDISNLCNCHKRDEGYPVTSSIRKWTWTWSNWKSLSREIETDSIPTEIWTNFLQKKERDEHLGRIPKSERGSRQVELTLKMKVKAPLLLFKIPGGRRSSRVDCERRRHRSSGAGGLRLAAHAIVGSRPWRHTETEQKGELVNLPPTDVSSPHIFSVQLIRTDWPERVNDSSVVDPSSSIQITTSSTMHLVPSNPSCKRGKTN